MKTLIFLHARMVRNRIRALTFTGEVKAAVFLLVICALFGAVYLGAWRLMSYLQQVEVAGPLLVNKLCAMLFLTSFSMVAFSSLVTSFTTIYLSRDLPWLMATPLPHRTVFTFKAVNTTFYASWMVLVALCPFVLALGQVKDVSFYFYLWTAVLMVPFLVLASLVGIAISLVLMRFFPAHRTRDILLFVTVLFITGVYVLFRFMQPERLVRPDGMEVVAQYLSFLDAPTASWLPSWWITKAALGFIGGGTIEAAYYAILLFAAAGAGALIVTTLSRRFFFEGWAEGQVVERSRTILSVAYVRRSPLKAMLEKDGRGFFRDANQWSQLLMLGALMTVYLFSIYKLPLDTMYLQNLMSFFNVALIGFILSAVALRFVFPSISLEGEHLYLVRSAPVPVSDLLFGKLIFGSVPVVVLGAVLAVISNWMLKADWPVFAISTAATLVMAAGLSALAVGFGASFPRFQLTNIAQIESSPGGLLYMLAALVYLGVNASLLALPLQNYYRFKFQGDFLPWNYFWWVALALALVNTVAIAAPLVVGLRKMEELEQ